MRTFLKNLFSRKNTTPKTKSKFNPRQLELLGLEERITPAVFSENSGLITIQLAANESLVGISASVTTSGSDAVVAINATSSGSNSIGSGTGLVLTNPSLVTYTGSNFTGIRVLGSTGTETVAISPSAVNLLATNPVSSSSFAIGSSVETLTVAGDITTKAAHIGLTADNISLAANLTTDTSGSITLNGPTTLISNVAIQTGGTLATDDIVFNSSLNGARNLNLTAGPNGDVSFTGQVGTGVALGTVTVVSAANVNAAGITAGTLTLTSVTTTADISGALNLTTLSSLSGVNNFRSTGSSGTITNAIAFTNTGDLTLGQSGGTQTYGAGIDTTGISGSKTVTLNGTIATTNNEIKLGAVTLGSATTLKTNSTTTGDIIAGAVSGTGRGLTLDVAQSRSATFNGLLTAASLTTIAGDYLVALNGGATITNAVSFLNTGGVTLGDATADILAFAGGLTSTASTTYINGTVRTNGTSMQLGAVALNGSSVLDTTNNGGTAAGSTIAMGAVTDGVGSYSLELKAGTSAVTFNGNVTINDLITNATAYSISMLGVLNSFDSQVDFLNTGDLTLGTLSTDQTLFKAGVNSTALRSKINVAGTIAAETSAAIVLNPGASGLVSVNANSTIGGLNTSGAITLGNVSIGNSNTLTLGDGTTNTNTIVTGSISGDSDCTPSENFTINTKGTTNVNGAVGTDIGTLKINQSGGTTFASTVNATLVQIIDGTSASTVEFQGNLNATSITAAIGTAAYNVAIKGSNNLIQNTATFSNTGFLTINDGADTTRFVSGVTATAPSPKNINGTIRATVGNINLGTTQVKVGSTTSVGIDNGGTITLGEIGPSPAPSTSNGVEIADGATLTVGTGSTGTIVRLGSVSGVSGGGATSNLTINTNGQTDVYGAVGTEIGTVTISLTGGTTFRSTVDADIVAINGVPSGGTATVAFQDNTVLNTLTTASIRSNISFTGTTNSIATATTFNNTGSGSGVTLGDGVGDSITFTNGLTVTSPRSLSISGTVNTTNTNMILGDTTLNNDTPITINGTSANPVILNAGLGTITLDGNISGTSPNDYLKPITSGAGSTTLSGTNSAEVLVTTGVVKIANTLDQTGGYTVTGGTLQGGSTGKVGYITATGGTVSPGNSAGKMISTDLTLTTGSTLAIELNGTATTDYDNLEVTNAPTLTGSTLSLSSTISPAAGTVFTIINNLSGNPVVGTFSGLAEGATITANGKIFQISYVGGTGNNDVILTTLATPTVTLNTTNLAYNATSITITGTGFVSTSTVTFSPLPSNTNYTVTINSSTSLTVNFTNLGQPAPANFQYGTLSAVVTNNVGSSTSVQVATIVATTSTALTTSGTPTVFGQPVTFTATVTGSDGSHLPIGPGTVTFKNGSDTLGTSTLNSSGVATLSFTSSTPLAVGNYNITAEYGGDAYNLTSTSPSVSQTVNQAATTTALVAAPTSSVFGQSVTFTATVTANSPGAGTPSGTVNFFDGANQIGTGTLSAGIATFITTGLQVNSYSITAVYAGDPSFLTSNTNSSPITFNVNRASTTTALVSSANPSVLGQSVTYTATVAAQAPGAGTPTGTVTFFDGSVQIGTGTLSNGTVSISTTSFTVGVHNITAVYAGSGSFNGSNSSLVTQTVNLAPVITSPNSATFIQGYTTNSFQIVAGGYPSNFNYSVTAGSLPAGVTLNPTTGIISGAPAVGTVGSYVVTLNVSNGIDPAATQVFTLTVDRAPVPLVTGSVPPSGYNSADPGNSVNLYNSETGQPNGVAVPFPNFMGQIRVASGDFNNDGRNEIVAGAGFGGGPAVAVLDSQTGAIRAAFFAYDPSFTGGIFVAVKDVNNDGVADIITGAGFGGGPHVKVFNGVNLQEMRSFFAYTETFTGGVSVATADINGDNIQDIITGAGPGGGPHVKVFDGATNSLISQWYAYPMSFSGGVFVALGDIGNDGTFEAVTGAGPGGGPVAAVWNPFTGQSLSQFLAYAPQFTGGVRVGVVDGTSDGINDLITGAGPTGGPHVKAFNYPNLDLLFEFFSGPETNPQGVFVS